MIFFLITQHYFTVSHHFYSSLRVQRLDNKLYELLFEALRHSNFYKGETLQLKNSEILGNILR